MLRLKSLGHPDCSKYGISIFKEALTEVGEIEAERIIGMAYATRVRNLKDDDFNDFIKSLKVDLKNDTDTKTEVERLKSMI